MSERNKPESNVTIKFERSEIWEQIELLEYLNELKESLGKNNLFAVNYGKETKKGLWLWSMTKAYVD